MSTDVKHLQISDLGQRHRTEMHRHIFEHPEYEVGGVIVGRLDGRTGKPRITGVIPALEAVGERASVTFTHEAWETILERQEEEFPNTQIVGWYHSHPGFGIFLSEHDLFIHRNFFGDQHQFAYVVDPIERSEGLFGWRDGDVHPIEKVPSFSMDHLGPAAAAGAAALAPTSSGGHLEVPYAAEDMPVSAPSSSKLTIGLDDLDDGPADDPLGGSPQPANGAAASAAVQPRAAAMAAPAPRRPLDPRAEAARQQARRRGAILAGVASLVLLGGIGAAVVTGGGSGEREATSAGIIDPATGKAYEDAAKGQAAKAAGEQNTALAAFGDAQSRSKAKWEEDHKPKVVTPVSPGNGNGNVNVTPPSDEGTPVVSVPNNPVVVPAVPKAPAPAPKPPKASCVDTQPDVTGCQP